MALDVYMALLFQHELIFEYVIVMLLALWISVAAPTLAVPAVLGTIALFVFHLIVNHRTSIKV